MFQGRPDNEYETGNGEASQQTALGLFQVQMRRSILRVWAVS